ncbi:MAG: fluoride efflux transporter CrcB [Coriobacteriia bacterium]|nr:fluoride efflux transporter CrcB [Coriobacteriia bacterium]
MLSALCVGAGGFVGALLRYLLGLLPWQGDFPLITFCINFAGSFLIGVVAEVAFQRVDQVNPQLILFLKTGLCGGFTTFSTFSLETLTLLEKGRFALGGAYAFGSLAVCLAGVMAGKAAARALLSAPTVS